MRILFGLVVVLLLAGCATSRENGYSEFYRPRDGITPEGIAEIRGARPAPPMPSVEHVQASDPVQVNAAYERQGYVGIGYSSFNTGYVPTLRDAVEQGGRVGADLVVVMEPHYSGSRTTSVPITTPTTQTYVTNGTATAYGSGGPVTAFGSSTTTAYGSQTNYVPMTVNRFDYEAIYFVKQSHFILGVTYRDLSASEHQAIQSNRGACITNVVDGQPAFNADILIGDFIVAADGTPVYGAKGFEGVLDQKHGQDVAFTIFRNGQTITKSVRLND